VFTGKFPSCGENLPLSLKAKVQCASCETFAEPSSRQVSAYSLILMVIAFVLYSADWRLIVLTIPVGLDIWAKLKYKTVDG